jgi:hypothetical protein
MAAKIYELIWSHQTTTSGFSVVPSTFTVPEHSWVDWEAVIIGISTDRAKYAVYRRRCVAFYEGGVDTTLETLTVGTDQETDAGLSASTGLSLGVIGCSVTGLAATTIDWRIFLTIRLFES